MASWPTHSAELAELFSVARSTVYRAVQRAAAASLDDLAAHILAFQAYYEVRARPFEWKFTRADLAKLLQRLASKEAGRLPEAA